MPQGGGPATQPLPKDDGKNNNHTNNSIGQRTDAPGQSCYHHGNRKAFKTARVVPEASSGAGGTNPPRGDRNWIRVHDGRAIEITSGSAAQLKVLAKALDDASVEVTQLLFRGGSFETCEDFFSFLQRYSKAKKLRVVGPFLRLREKINYEFFNGLLCACAGQPRESVRVEKMDFLQLHPGLSAAMKSINVKTIETSQNRGKGLTKGQDELVYDIRTPGVFSLFPKLSWSPRMLGSLMGGFVGSTTIKGIRFSRMTLTEENCGSFCQLLNTTPALECVVVRLEGIPLSAEVLQTIAATVNTKSALKSFSLGDIDYFSYPHASALVDLIQKLSQLLTFSLWGDAWIEFHAFSCFCDFLSTNETVEVFELPVLMTTEDGAVGEKLESLFRSNIQSRSIHLSLEVPKTAVARMWKAFFYSKSPQLSLRLTVHTPRGASYQIDSLIETIMRQNWLVNCEWNRERLTLYLSNNEAETSMNRSVFFDVPPNDLFGTINDNFGMIRALEAGIPRLVQKNSKDNTGYRIQSVLVTDFVLEGHFKEFVTNSPVLQPTVRELRLACRRFEPPVDTICRLVKGSDFIHMLEIYVGSDFNETRVALMKDAFSANKTLTSIVIIGHDDYVKLIKPGLYSLRNRIAEIPAEEAFLLAHILSHKAPDGVSRGEYKRNALFMCFKQFVSCLSVEQPRSG